MLTLPARIDLTSVPLSSIPASYFSENVEIAAGLPVGGDFRAHGRHRRSESGRSGSFAFWISLILPSMISVRAMSATPMLGRVGINGRAAAVELSDALGDQIDQDQRVGDNFGGLFKEIAFHRRTGKSRNRLRLLKRDDVFGKQGRFFFAQNRWMEKFPG